MKKIIFGIFAHPDDEAFGPCGTLLQETKNGTDVHLIMLTAGDAGMNPDNVPDIGKTRLDEWHAAGELLGTKSMHFLDYKDGQLSNSLMIEITDRISAIITETIQSYSDDIEIECMSFDFTGLSGHIDHIVAARITCLVFYRLKQHDSRFTRTRLLCLPLSRQQTHSIEWLYREAGRQDYEIDEIIDARHLQDEIITVMRAHNTQRSDCESILQAWGDSLGMNYFVVKT